jgi:mono/diheme cytochrome c family protein/cytochrome c553
LQTTIAGNASLRSDRVAWRLHRDRSMRIATVSVIALGLLLARALHAAPPDVSGSYAGTLTPRRQAASPASAALTQSGKSITGSVVLQLPQADLAGVFTVNGTASGKRVRLTGVAGSGARLVWRGKISATGLSGKARLRGAQSRVTGTLALSRNDTVSGGGASCDTVFTQNQSFFETQVMGQVLTVCASCHVAGGQAQAARLRVTMSDPLATARTVALLVNPTDPAASRILQKPLAQIPHGGGQQIVPGSPQEQILRSWVDLIAQSGCVSTAVAGGTGDVFAVQCAGCHGADGSGAGAAPDIRCTIAPRIVDAVRQGRGTVMPAFAMSEVSANDLHAIESYLAGNCSGAGADLFASNCATCHGPTGGGGRNADGVGGPNIRCSDEIASAVRFGGEGMPAFGALGDAAIARLARWVQGLCALGGGGGGD